MANEQQKAQPQPAKQEPQLPAQQVRTSEQQPSPPRLSQMRDGSIVGTGWKNENQKGEGDNLQYGQKIIDTIPESD